MKAININDDYFPFTDCIIDGVKTVETREKRTLKSLVGTRVGIISTSKTRKALLVGYVNIIDEIKYNSEEEFRTDYKKHLVLPGSKFDIKPGCVKYGYVLADPERCDPVPVNSKGIVIRNI